jgi:hypothetical protein
MAFCSFFKSFFKLVDEKNIRGCWLKSVDYVAMQESERRDPNALRLLIFRGTSTIFIGCHLK